MSGRYSRQSQRSHINSRREERPTGSGPVFYAECVGIPVLPGPALDPSVMASILHFLCRCDLQDSDCERLVEPFVITPYGQRVANLSGGTQQFLHRFIQVKNAGPIECRTQVQSAAVKEFIQTFRVASEQMRLADPSSFSKPPIVDLHPNYGRTWALHEDDILVAFAVETLIPDAPPLHWSIPGPCDNDLLDPPLALPYFQESPDATHMITDEGDIDEAPTTSSQLLDAAIGNGAEIGVGQSGEVLAATAVNDIHESDIMISEAKTKEDTTQAAAVTALNTDDDQVTLSGPPADTAASKSPPLKPILPEVDGASGAAPNTNADAVAKNHRGYAFEGDSSIPTAGTSFAMSAPPNGLGSDGNAGMNMVPTSSSHPLVLQHWMKGSQPGHHHHHHHHQTSGSASTADSAPAIAYMSSELDSEIGNGNTSVISGQKRSRPDDSHLEPAPAHSEAAPGSTPESKRKLQVEEDPVPHWSDMSNPSRILTHPNLDTAGEIATEEFKSETIGQVSAAEVKEEDNKPISTSAGVAATSANGGESKTGEGLEAVSTKKEDEDASKISAAEAAAEAVVDDESNDDSDSVAALDDNGEIIDLEDKKKDISLIPAANAAIMQHPYLIQVQSAIHMCHAHLTQMAHVIHQQHQAALATNPNATQDANLVHQYQNMQAHLIHLMQTHASVIQTLQQSQQSPNPATSSGGTTPAAADGGSAPASNALASNMPISAPEYLRQYHHMAALAATRQQPGRTSMWGGVHPDVQVDYFMRPHPHGGMLAEGNHAADIGTLQDWEKSLRRLLDWVEVMRRLPWRSKKEILNRFEALRQEGKFSCVLKARRGTGRPLTREEEIHLSELVDSHGHKWTDIAKNMSDRFGFQYDRKRLREHYTHKVAAEPRKRSDWTNEEDATLMRLFEVHGRQWVKISSQLPGRSNHDVKNRYHSLERYARRGKFFSQ